MKATPRTNALSQSGLAGITAIIRGRTTRAAGAMLVSGVTPDALRGQQMTPTLWWFLILVVPFVIMAGAALAFIAAELEAMRDQTDDRYTLSEYWAWAKRIHPTAWNVLQVTGSLLCAGIIVLGIWLFGHWVLEAW